MKVDIRSEIGRLTDVVLHSPGPEVENMTPGNAERALYNDILNLSVAKEEYSQFFDLLKRVCNTYQVKDLLESVLTEPMVKEPLVRRICKDEGFMDLYEGLLALPPKELARNLIEGVTLPRDNLTRFLSKERFSLRPLHNFFFTRDAAMAIGDEILIGRMAKPVRARESIIMEAIFSGYPQCAVNTVNLQALSHPYSDATVEGGDLLVARDDVLVVGSGSRTSSKGIDLILERIKSQKKQRQHIVVQELPHSPESFIHLDMVFTFLDQQHCMVFEPLILRKNKYPTIHIQIENGRVESIHEENGLIDVLRKLGMDLKVICCGARSDPWIQEREQWHSGANFFALGPGQVVGYARNVHTLEEMNRNGFEIIAADEVISGKYRLSDLGQCAVTLQGSELPRGGGGARCMTMPVCREPVAW